MEDYRVYKHNENKYFVERYTAEFGYVFLLKKNSLEPMDFTSENEALNHIKMLKKIK